MLIRHSFQTLRCCCLATVILGWGLTGCSVAPVQDGAPRGRARDGIDIAAIPDATPRSEPLSKHGNPESYEIHGKSYHTLKSAQGFSQRGIASWYGAKFHGRRTSSGETYDMYQMTAAHTALPIPSYAEVTNLLNGRRVIVKVNDRGPFHANRVIDLSYVAALKLDIVKFGTGVVEIRAIDPRAPQPPAMQRVPRAPAKQPTEIRQAPVRVADIQRPFERVFLQVGAFEDAPKAERLRQQVTGLLGRIVQIREDFSGARRLYKVQVGPLVDLNIADHILETLSRAGLEGRYVIPTES